MITNSMMMHTNFSVVDSANMSSDEIHLPHKYIIGVNDATMILVSTFIIFTMQTGFGMLESGCVSVKNEANIMMKNIADTSLGGITYWLYGYGLTFGVNNNGFIGLSNFLVDPPAGDELMGAVYAAFLFQLSFATTATTIVSGAMAERCRFPSYCVFSLMNTALYAIAAGWIWGDHGFLSQLGVVDIGGSGPIHLIGGSISLGAAIVLGPRMNRFKNGSTDPLPIGNPINAIMGLFLLWWGWLAFNSGSAYGVTGAKWDYSARAGVMTMLSSFGGAVFGLLYTMIKNKGIAQPMDVVNSVLGALVSVTAGCFLYTAWESILIGFVGAAIVNTAAIVIDKLRIDDPLCSVAVHGFGGMWGVIAVGLFAQNPIPLTTTNGRTGLLRGGGWELLGIQSLSALCLFTWGVLSGMILLSVINLIIPLRMSEEEERLGADLTEHGIIKEPHSPQADVEAPTKAALIYSDNAIKGSFFFPNILTPYELRRRSPNSSKENLSLKSSKSESDIPARLNEAA